VSTGNQGLKIVADRIGHANMAYTLAIYTHKSTEKDRGAAETIAGVLLGTGRTCSKVRGHLHRGRTRRRAMRTWRQILNFSASAKDALAT